MRKDQLLKRLKEMLDAVNHDKVLDVAQKSKEEELDKINKQREMLNFEIQELKTKLEDDSNYQDFSYMKNQTKIYDYNYRIGKIEEELAQNEVNKMNNENRISAVTREIEASKALLSEEQKNLERYSAELRKLGNNPTPEQDKQILDKIAEARAGIQFVKNEISQYNEEMKDLLANKKQINQRLETLSNSKDRYNALLNSIKEIEANKKDTIDKNKKENDQRKLLQLQATVKSFSGREEYLSFDFPLELETLIYNVENDRISNEEALEKLQEMKAKMPDKIINKDYVNADEEIAENQRMQAEVLIEKTALEEKLKNPDNYLPSIFAVEAMNQEISELEDNVAKYDADIQAIDANIIKYENSKKDCDFKVEQEEKNKEDLNAKLFDLRLKQIVLPTEVYETQKDEINQEKKKIQKQINDIDRRIERLTKSSLASDLVITLSKKERKNLENLKNNELKLLDNRNKTLSERSGVDKYLLAQDQTKLDSLNNQLAILKMRENAIYYDYETELDEMISRLKKAKSTYIETKKDDYEPIISTDGLEDMDVVSVSPEELYKDSVSKNETKEDQTVVSPIIVGGEQKQDEEIIPPVVVGDEYELDDETVPPTVVEGEAIEEPADEEEYDEEYDDEQEPVPIMFWKKAKDSVLNKIRDKEFLKKLKIGLVVAGGLALGLLLSRCGDEKVVAPPIEEVATVETATPETATPETATPETAEEPEIEEEPEAPKKSIEEIAWEVIHGDWGNGQERKDRLNAAGYDYDEVQKKVNELLKTIKKPSTNNNGGYTGGSINTGGGIVVNPTPETPVITNPDVTNPDVTYPDIIFPNPDYPDPITPDEIPDPELPDPIYPEPDPDPVLDSVEVTVQPGDTFVMDTPDGSVAVDNSNLENSDVAGDVNYDYTTSDSIDGVTFDDSTGNVTVEVNPDNVSAPQDNMTEEKQDDYDAVLEEMGMSEGGKTR